MIEEPTVEQKNRNRGRRAQQPVHQWNTICIRNRFESLQEEKGRGVQPRRRMRPYKSHRRSPTRVKTKSRITYFSIRRHQTLGKIPLRAKSVKETSLRQMNPHKRSTQLPLSLLIRR